jgi:lysozyme
VTTTQAPRRGAVAVTAGALAIMVALAAGHEGEVRHAYVDRLGKGNPITWCYGETGGGVRIDQTFTHEECVAALSSSARAHAGEVALCLPLGLPDKTAAAFYDAGYNLGTATFCKSSMSRLARQGNLRAACNAIGLYVFTGGKDCRDPRNRCAGIVRRREDERALCLEGLR